MRNRHIIVCDCKGERIKRGLLSDIDSHLQYLPVPVTKISDLCGLIQKDKAKISQIMGSASEFLVLGCYPRSMKLILDQVMQTNPAISYLNLVEEEKENVYQAINEFSLGQDATPFYEELTEESGWPSWYPLVDYSRCTSCGQCADFCLFGVYIKANRNVKVVNPENCKNNCPACARICPATAIVFPKYRHGGAIGGSEDINEQAELARQSRDIEEFLGNDIYSALEKRKAKRQSVVRQEALNKAIAERDNALKENKK